MWKAMTLCLGLSCVLLSGCVRWTEFTSYDSNFTVLFPDPPKEKKVTQKTPLGEIKGVQFESEKRGHTLIVSHMVLPDIINAFSADKVLGALMKSTPRVYKSLHITSRRRIKLGDVAGMALSASGKQGSTEYEVKFRVFLKEEHGYQITIVAKKGELKPEWVTKFFSSFKLTD